MKEHDYFLFFSCTSGIGPKTFLKLLNHFKTAENIYNATGLDLENSGLVGRSLQIFLDSKKNFDINNYLEKMKKAKVEYIPSFSNFYPKGLKNIDSLPIGLFIKGNKNLLQAEQNISIVGARKITTYGRDVTEQIASSLAQSNIVITSGMALGVDRVAHESVLRNKGETVAVLGCGVDCAYPRENQKLYEQILDNNGLVISEYPMGMSANMGTFPARNRLIAGISQAVVVTEAAEDSGSLITTEYAFKYEKKVFAVPGSINSPMSRGALKLLRKGAVMAVSGKDILRELEIRNYGQRANKNNLDELKLSKEEILVCNTIINEGLVIDHISRNTKIPVFKLMAILSDLELQGIVKKQDNMWVLSS